MDEAKILSRLPLPEEAQVERQLRPQRLDEYVGQGEAVESLRVSLEAARQRAEPVDHVLLYGPQKARNIVAQLQAKVAKFALLKEPGVAPEPSLPAPSDEEEGVRSLVWEVLVKQLGHRPSEAAQLITEALRRKPGIKTAEELFDEIYRGRKP